MLFGRRTRGQVGAGPADATGREHVRRELFEEDAALRVERDHLEGGGGRLVQRRVAALQQAHERLHPAHLRDV